MTDKNCTDCGSEEPIRIENTNCEEPCHGEECYEKFSSDCITFPTDVVVGDDVISPGGGSVTEVINDLAQYLTDNPPSSGGGGGGGGTPPPLECNTKVVTPKDFGAVGDGVTDDTVAIQAMINSCHNVFDGMNLTYLVSNTLFLRANMVLENLKLTAIPDFSGATFQVLPGTTSPVEFPLQTNLSKADSLVSPSSAGTLQRGDFFIVTSGKSYSTQLGFGGKGEPMVVAGLQSSSVAIMDNTIASYNTVDGAKIKIIPTTKNIVLRNIEVDSPESFIVGYFEQAEKITIDNLRAKGSENYGFLFITSKDILIENCTLESTLDNLDPQQAAIFISEGCLNVTIQNNVFYGYATVLFANMTETINKDIYFKNNQTFSTNVQHITTGDSVWNIEIDNNTFSSLPGERISGVSVGFGPLRMRNNVINDFYNVAVKYETFATSDIELASMLEITGNTFISKENTVDPSRVAIRCEMGDGVGGSLAQGFIISNNQFRTRGQGMSYIILISLGSSDGNRNFANVMISNNYSEGSATMAGIAVLGTGSGAVEGVVVSNNNILCGNNGTGTAPVVLAGNPLNILRGVTVTGNVLKGGNSSIFLSRSDSATISGNSYVNENIKLSQNNNTDLHNYDI